MADFHIATVARNAMLTAIRDKVDAGGAAGKVRFYSGSKPTNANTALSGNTLLAELALSYPCAPPASGGMLPFSPITDDSSADATGDVTFARVFDSAGNVVFQCDVAAAGGGAVITINTMHIAAGGPVRINSFAIVLPA